MDYFGCFWADFGQKSLLRYGVGKPWKNQKMPSARPFDPTDI
jgi:hypothetical protein